MARSCRLSQLALVLCFGAASPVQAQTCVEARVGSERAYECVNQALERMARGAATMNTLGATSPAPAVGTFNRAATAERMGNTFGHSIHAQRPAPPIFVNPLVHSGR